MATTRTRQLEKLAGSLPGANQRVTQGLEQARTAQLQQEIKQLRGPGTTQTAQQMGGQLAGQKAGINLQAAQQQQGQMQQLAQQGLQQQGREQRAQGFQQQLSLAGNQREQADRLANLDRDAKNKLLDQQLAFRVDESGRQVFNQRQMADWALTNAQSQEQYAAYAQAAQQASQRKMQIMKTAYQKIDQVLQQGYIQKNKPLDQALKKKLAEQRQAMQISIQKEQAKAANSSAMWQAGGAILGGIGGAVVGGPAGAAAGASIGGGLATTLQTQFGG